MRWPSVHAMRACAVHTTPMGPPTSRLACQPHGNTPHNLMHRRATAGHECGVQRPTTACGAVAGAIRPGYLPTITSGHSRRLAANAVADRATDLLRAEPGVPSSLRVAADAAGRNGPSAKEVFEHAAAGDALAASIVDSTAEYLAVGCINVCRAFDPQVIVVTGGLALAGELAGEPVVGRTAAGREGVWAP